MEIKHVAFIMDGNGRWATSRGLKRIAGHKKGAQTLKRIIKKLITSKIACASFFAFSTENFNRPKEEVDGILDIIRHYFLKNLSAYDKENVKISFIGNRSLLPQDINDILNTVENKTRNNDGLNVILALGYGGRDDILRAVNKIVEQGETNISEQKLEQYLDTCNQPAPDLIIRTGGQKRLSNFFLYQAAYSELFFTDTLWPDFSARELNAILGEYQGRLRNYGGIK